MNGKLIARKGMQLRTKAFRGGSRAVSGGRAVTPKT